MTNRRIDESGSADLIGHVVEEVDETLYGFDLIEAADIRADPLASLRNEARELSGPTFNQSQMTARSRRGT